MKRILKPVAFLIISAFMLNHAKAQNVSTDTLKDQKDQNIIIHKKGSSKQKFNVVIDGDKVTINGKPVDEFKSDDIDIIENDAPNIAMDFENSPNTFSFSGPDGDISFPPVAPMAPSAPQVRAFRNDMMQNVKSNHAFLGVMSEKTNDGAKITEVTKKSAAEKAGLKETDVITKIDKETINGPDDLYKVIGTHKPDDKITVTYLRNGKQLTAQVTLEKSNQIRVYSWNAPNVDMDFPRNFSFSLNDNKPRLGVEVQDTEDGNGVKVNDITDDDAPGAKAGLKEGDVISQINGTKISSVDDLRESMKNVKKGDTVKISYKRDNQTQTVDVKFPKDLKTADL